MSTLRFDPLTFLRESPEKMNIPGGMLSKGGPQDYVGAVPAIAGVLYFNDAHLAPVREALAECFDDYRAVFGKHLTWLHREAPPDGPGRLTYEKAKPLRLMMSLMEEEDALSFHYTSGKQGHAAGPCEFQIQGISGWRARMGGWGLCALRFSVPLLYVDENPTAFQAMFVSFAKRVKACHGYGGYGLILSATRYEENQAFEAFLSGTLRGFDAGELVSGAASAHLGLKSVSWLTAVDHDIIQKVGGLSAIRSELPMDWFALYDYGAGIVIQSGSGPDGAPADVPAPALLVLPNLLFKVVRAPDVGLHYATAGSEPRLIGRAAANWLSRFDIPENELLAYKARLLSEPKLAPNAVLPGRL